MTCEVDPDLARSVEAEVRSLATMSLQELRIVWDEKWGAPPRQRSTHLLRQLLAWRLQAAVYGGLDQETRVRIRSGRVPRHQMPPIGSRLIREYQGVVHTVEVRDDGVHYQGTRFRNLSAAAKAITGTHWNGPRFFGLRRGRQ